MLFIFFDVLGWIGWTIVGLLLVGVVLVLIIRHQRTRHALLRHEVTELAKEIDVIEAEFAKFGEQISRAREQTGVPTIDRSSNETQQQSHNPQQLSFRKEFMRRLWALLSMLNSKFRDTELAPVTPADLKLRLTSFQKKLRFEGDRVNQLAEFVAPTIQRDTGVGTAQFHADDASRQIHGTAAIDESAKAALTGDVTDSFIASINQAPPPFDSEEPDSSLLGLYNQAVIDNQAREEFRERFKPVRIGTINAVERRQNPTLFLAPEFKEASDGDFFAIPLDGANVYAVVPRLGLTIGAVSYNAGALGEIFGNPSYDSARSYCRYCVREPAIFKHDNDQWTKVRSGEIELGPPD